MSPPAPPARTLARERLRVIAIIALAFPPARPHRDGECRGRDRTREGSGGHPHPGRGLGVPEAERGQIFERFSRTSVAKPYGGVSLGLYISKEIVTRMGGDVQLESSGGNGSVFRVTLPLQRMPATSAK